jgi:hypothetical protein
MPTNACCIGHPCDDCDTCRSGVCCLTVQAASPPPAQPSDLHVAACHEISAAGSDDLGQLLRIELVISGGAVPPAALPKPAPPLPVFTEVLGQEVELADAPRQA